MEHSPIFVAGVDGCHAGWIAFKVELPSRVTSVEVIDLPAWLSTSASIRAKPTTDPPLIWSSVTERGVHRGLQPSSYKWLVQNLYLA